jgi:gas vesicle protein
MGEKKAHDGKKGDIRRKLDRLLLGVVVGGAVGSILGITLAPKAGRETRQIMRDRSRETWQRISEIIDEKAAKNRKHRKKGVWHLLHRLIFRKRDHE